MSLLEQRLALADGVVEGVLEVGVRVHANEVGSLDSGAVRAIDPGSPGVNVTDGNLAECSTSESLLDLANVVGYRGRASPNAGQVDDSSGRVTVEILTAHCDTITDACQLVAIGGDGGLESTELGIEPGLTARGPHAQEERRAWNSQRGRDGGDDIAGGTRLLHTHTTVSTDRSSDDALPVRRLYDHHLRSWCRVWPL